MMANPIAVATAIFWNSVKYNELYYISSLVTNGSKNIEDTVIN